MVTWREGEDTSRLYTGTGNWYARWVWRRNSDKQ
jgi:hypothetical protein